MNFIDAYNPIKRALEATKVSKDLQKEFLDFLSDYPEYKSQATYLLTTKKESIEKIVFDLFDVPIKEQPGWTKAGELQKEKTSSLLHGNADCINKTPDVMPRLLFKEWRQEHGFDSPLLEIGDIHTIIRFTKHIAPDLEIKYRWEFFKSRYGKRSWGKEKKIKYILKALLDNNSNPGWVVRSFLEENYFLTDINNAPRPVNELPNPLVLDAHDSHALLYLVLGNPYLFYDTAKLPITNSEIKVTPLLYRYESDDGYFIHTFFEYERPLLGITIIDAQEFIKTGVILPGEPTSIIFNNQYHKLTKNKLPLRMIQGSLSGVLVPKKEWDGFIENWHENYQDYPILNYKKNSKNLPSLAHFKKRNIKDWQNWLIPPHSFNDSPVNRDLYPIIKLHPTSYQYKSNKISFNIENLNQPHLENLAKLPEHRKLLSMIELGLHLRTMGNQPGMITFERHEASQFLRLLEYYPFAFNDQGRPLFSKNSLDYHLTVKKHPTNPKQYFLQGSISLPQEKTTISGLKKRSRINIKNIRAIGLVPSYLIYNEQLMRISDMLSARLVNDSLIGIVVGKEGINDFYTITLPFLKQRDIKMRDKQGLLRISALYNYKLQGHINIWEVKGMLMGHLKSTMNTGIGQFTYPLGISNEKFSHKLDGYHHQILRNKAQETSLLDHLYSHGWIDEGGGEYSMNEMTAIRFILDILPVQTGDEIVKYYGSKKLSRWKVKNVIPQFTTNISSGINWFDLKIDINYEGKKLDVMKIIEIWKNGSHTLNFNNDNGIALIDKDWLAKHAPILNRLAESNKRLIDNNQEKQLDDASNGGLAIENFQIGLLNELVESSKKVVADNHWKNLVRRLKNFTRIETHNIPPEVKANLRDYQKIGVNWLIMLKKFGFCGILADDMGLGKTLQTLAFLALERKQSKRLAPALVVAPTSVVFNWKVEVEKFVPHLKCLILKGANRHKHIKNLAKYDLIITSYNILQRDISLLKEHKLSTLVLDEAQMIRNFRSKNAQTVSMLNADFKISLTGTPIENSVMELWSQFNFLMPGLTGTQKEFYRNYVRVGRNHTSKYNLDILSNQTRPFILRRMKQKVATELPDKTEQTILCEMNPEQQKLYDTVLAAIKSDLSPKINGVCFTNHRIAIFDGMLKLRQICCDPRLSQFGQINPPPSTKMQVFMDTLTEIVEEGHRVLVFSQFVKMLELMHPALKEKNINFLQLDGSVSNRQQLVDDFQENDGFPVFLISLKAGGTGINLTAADYVIHYDPWWNPAVETQATDRAHRIGQKKQVHVYKLITTNSIEEKIQVLQKRKKTLSNRVIKSSDNIENIFNPKDLSEIFDL
ncbi:MAG: DEAD/DEAH box helicase [SAR324 cluster bacterium]|nr:DEAD/DEAH box helicase [SAR324 cluster bacterium]